MAEEITPYVSNFTGPEMDKRLEAAAGQLFMGGGVLDLTDPLNNPNLVLKPEYTPEDVSYDPQGGEPLIYNMFKLADRLLPFFSGENNAANMKRPDIIIFNCGFYSSDAYSCGQLVNSLKEIYLDSSTESYRFTYRGTSEWDFIVFGNGDISYNYNGD